jgi:SAM-dependent methyltransferase
MSRIEQGFCRSAPWRGFSRSVVVTWALGDRELTGGVLELGSGSGAMAAELLDRFPDVRLCASDLDGAMLEAARQRLAAFQDRAAVESADATSLPFEDASFDVVVSFLMLHHVIDWEEAVGEAVRVLRPGGLFAGYDLVDSRTARVVHRLDGSPHRLATADAIRTRLEELDVEDVAVTSALGGLVARFAAKKGGAGGRLR